MERAKESILLRARDAEKRRGIEKNHEPTHLCPGWHHISESKKKTELTLPRRQGRVTQEKGGKDVGAEKRREKHRENRPS